MDVDGEDNDIHELSEGSDDDDDNSQEIKDLEVSYFVRAYFRPMTKFQVSEEWISDKTCDVYDGLNCLYADIPCLLS